MFYFTKCESVPPSQREKAAKIVPIEMGVFKPESEDWNSSYVKQKRVLIIVKRRDPVVRFTSPAVMFISSVTLGQVFNFYMSGS